MRVGVGVLTFNHLTPRPRAALVPATELRADLQDEVGESREQDFKRCWESIAKTGYPAEIHLLTNGSTDGTEDVVRELGGIVDNGNPQIWYGNQRLVEAMGDVDLCVLSADDLEYEKNWLRRLVSFIENGPDDIALYSCQMEPVWGWNTPTETVKAGGETALIRNSVPGSSWAFRREDWETWMGPFPQVMPGEDLQICQKIQAEGKRMAALDLVEHIGVEHSAWGNQSHLTAEPLDKEAWGLA